MFQINGDKKLNIMPNPRLDPIPEGKKMLQRTLFGQLIKVKYGW